MIFTNTPNEEAQLKDGRTVWLSRSPAVVMILVGMVKGKAYFLFGKRGPKCPDEIGKWSLPCGYMDWDESGTDAARRETFEETGVVLDDIHPVVSYMDQPWHVNHHPTSNKQNISLYFGMVFKVDSVEELPRTTTENADEGEVDEIRWVSLKKGLDFAFGHDELADKFLDKLAREEWNAVF